MTNSFLFFFRKLVKPIFGEFEPEEFIKFLRLGSIFAFIIGTYWTLRPLKNAVFCTLVGAVELPWAKTISLIALVFILMAYTKLLDLFAHKKIFYILSIVYAIIALLGGLLLMSSHIGQASCEIISTRTGAAYIGTKLLAYVLYVFIESFGSLVPALFWAMATDTTMPESAKKGFSFVVAIGQFGGIVGPFIIAGLPQMLGFATNALSFFICAVTILVSSILLRNFFAKTPVELLQSFHGTNERTAEKEQEPGFFEGLRLLLKHKYLLGIFGVIAFPEIIATIFDLHFHSLAAQHYSGTALAHYLGLYGSSVNIVALLFLLCGASSITRIFGVGISLVLMPFIYGLSVLGFVSFTSLTFLFGLMASSKAINYALNGPAIKQLYIPTTPDVRFKSQAWMETFGSRGAKEVGTVFNMLLDPLQKQLGEIAGRARHAILASYFSFAVVTIWIIVALFLGKKYKTSVDAKKVVC